MTLQAPILLLPPRVTREPQFDAVTGSVGHILFTMFGPPQHDSHVQKWRWHIRLRGTDRCSPAVAELADEICAKARARRGVD